MALSQIHRLRCEHPAIALTPFVSGFSSPVDFETPDDGSGRNFVVHSRNHPHHKRRRTSAIAISGHHQQSKLRRRRAGLLGLALHPNYSQNRRFYVDYDRLLGGQPQTVIAEYQLSPDPNSADVSTERILLTVNQPFTNHKGGQMAFGPNGFLYIAMGDGGSGGDPLGNGQNTQPCWAKSSESTSTTSLRDYSTPFRGQSVRYGRWPG